MEATTDHWSSQQRSGRSPGSSKLANATNRRNADRERELQRLKSLGVVSVLNKTFDSQDNMLAPAPIPSPSSSTSSSTMLTERAIPKPTISSSSGTSFHHQIQDDDNNLMPAKQQYHRSQVDIKVGDDSSYQQGGDQQQQHWVMAILPAEQGEPRLNDGEGNPMTLALSARTALNNDSMMALGATCENDEDQQLFHIDNHSSLIDHHLQVAQLLQQTQRQLVSCQSEQKQMEQDTKHTLERWLSQKELESVKVQQLSEVILKQDLVIHELEATLSSVVSDNEQLRQTSETNDHHDTSGGGGETDDTPAETKQELVSLRQELADLQVHKAGYEQMIVTLCSELESSQDETRKLTLLTTSLNQQCQQQQEQIDGKIGNLMQQLADKDALIRKYRDGHYGNHSELTGNYRQDLQQQQRYSLLVNDSATTHSALSASSSSISVAFSDQDSALARYSSASSYSRSSLRGNNNTKQRHSRNSIPRRKGKAGANVVSWPNGYIPPPSGPPPSIPLPPLPIVDDDQVDPELKHMTNAAQHSDDNDDDDDDDDDELEEEQQALTSSLEQLLLQAPSGYTLDDDTTMNEAYREFTEQLQSRLSMPKELDHLKLWDHDALERLRLQQMAIRRRASHAPTTHTATSSSSQWSAASSSILSGTGGSDLDGQQQQQQQQQGRDNSAFWKGMKKKLHV